MVMRPLHCSADTTFKSRAVIVVRPSSCVIAPPYDSHVIAHTLPAAAAMALTRIIQSAMLVVRLTRYVRFTPFRFRLSPRDSMAQPTLWLIL